MSDQNNSKNFDCFQQDGLDYLYSLEPTQNNLFWAGNFNDGNITPNKGPGNEFPNAQFRIQSVGFQLPSLEFEELKPLKIQVLKSIKTIQEVSITWIEDVYRSVERYHLDWINCWYNRRFDCVVTGPKGKFRKLDVYLFHYNGLLNESINDGVPSIVQPKTEQIAHITLSGLAPKSIGDMKFEMGNSGAEGTKSITYIVNKVDIEYADKIGPESGQILPGIGTGSNLEDEGKEDAKVNKGRYLI